MLSKLLNFPLQSLPGWWRRRYTIGVIVFISVLLHGWAVWQLPLDADEPVYMRAGREYAQRISSGDLNGIINYSENREHPPLVKLIYSIPYLLKGDSPPSQFEFYTNRAISALFGVLQVLLISLVDPLAGFFLAFHSYTLKYTSQVYLEALPLFTSLLAMLSLRRALAQKEGDRVPWWWISAAAFGVMAASKYTYLMMAIPAAFLVFTQGKVNWRRLAGYVLMVLAVFWVLNPYLWNDPINRLVDSLFFHARYTQGFDVTRANYPWFQPLIWIATAAPWHPGVFFFLTLDEFIFWAGMVGTVFFIRKQPWLVVWFLSNFAILLVWPTKWPQYSLILIPALCMLASGLLRWAYGWIKVKNDYWDYLEEMLPKPPKVFWWILIFFIVGIVGGKVIYEYERALDRRGWSSIIAEVSPLPGNTIHELVLRSNGSMVLGTDHGAAIWQPTARSPWGEESSVFNSDNSGIVDNRIRAILEDRQGGLWFGTERGLSVLKDGNWQAYRAENIGLESDQVRALAEDSRGRIWVGTISGLAAWDGENWEQFTAENSDLPDDSVFALAILSVQNEDQIWIGTLKGVAQYIPVEDHWSTWDFSSRDLGWGGVSDLMVDSQNRIWMATLGGGLGVWDGNDWELFRNNNSPIPTSVVKKVIETSPGFFWIGLGFSTEPGGVLARFDGENWKRFTPSNSGFGGGEPFSMAVDQANRLWVGTATNGLQIFELTYDQISTNR